MRKTMRKKRKGAALELLLCALITLIGLGEMIYGTRMETYTATVKEVSEVYMTSERTGRNHSQDYYTVNVTAAYTDEAGRTGNVQNLIYRNAYDPDKLPKMGDSVTIKKNMFGRFFREEDAETGFHNMLGTLCILAGPGLMVYILFFEKD